MARGKGDELAQTAAKNQGKEPIMFVRIDQALDVPLYQQLRNEIVRGIAQEELAPGDALPSVRNLASDLGINLHTVNKAYALLRDEGYVEMKGRKGAFVAQPAAAAGMAASSTWPAWRGSSPGRTCPRITPRRRSSSRSQARCIWSCARTACM